MFNHYTSYGVEATAWTVAVLRTAYARDYELIAWLEEEQGLLPRGYLANITADNNIYVI